MDLAKKWHVNDEVRRLTHKSSSKMQQLPLQRHLGSRDEASRCRRNIYLVAGKASTVVTTTKNDNFLHCGRGAVQFRE